LIHMMLFIRFKFIRCLFITNDIAQGFT
jgi:hypothetical protein